MTNPSWESDDQDQTTSPAETPRETPAAKSKGRSRRTSRRGNGSNLTPAQARKAISVLAAIRDADESTATVAAEIAGTPGADRNELAITVLTGKAKSSQALKDVAEIANAELMEAAVVTGMLPKARLKNAWELMRSTGAELPTELPDADVKAAIALAKAIHERTDDQITILEGASTLLAE